MDDLSAARALAALADTRFRRVEVYASLASTQSMLVSEGGPDGRVVVADHQTAGRGRAGRTWSSVPGRALLFSALLRDGVSLVTLAAGVAVARALRTLADAAPRLKWPNDVLLDGDKVCGILGELAPDGGFVVVGIGVNVRQDADQLPRDVRATSVRLATGRDLRRDDLLVAILRELDSLPAAPAWLDEYRTLCATLGSRVRVELAGESFEGEASEVRDDGALVVDGRALLSGDVLHVRSP